MSPFFGSRQSLVHYRSSITPISNTTASLSTQLSTFELLPLELREKVYAYLGYELSTDLIYELPNSSKPHPTKREITLKFWYNLEDNTLRDAPKRYQEVQKFTGDRAICPNPYPALLLVCKLITGDLYALIYSKSIFTIRFDISAALESSPEKSPFTIGPRILSFFTHVIIGPIRVPKRMNRSPVVVRCDREAIYDAQRLPALITSVHLLTRHCRHLELLGVGMWNLDVIRGLNQLPSMTKALRSAVWRCPQLKWVIIGIGVHDSGTTLSVGAVGEGPEQKAEQLTKWVQSRWSSFMYLTEDHHRDHLPKDD